MPDSAADSMGSSRPHIPVMMSEVLEYLQPELSDIIVDGTFGAGGYSRTLLERTGCAIVALDRDPSVQVYAEGLSKAYGERFKLLLGNFADMESVLAEAGVERVDGIVLDLGVSSMQLDRAERGFSFRQDGPLDMRMGSDGTTAADIVNTMKQEELADLIYLYGDERASRKIASAIVRARALSPIETTRQLVEIVHSVLRPKHNQKIDPATRTFQALRIAVNKELEALEKVLLAAERLLTEGGRLVVVTFHSLEDRIVKQFMQTHADRKQHVNKYRQGADEEAPSLFSFVNLTPKAVLASERESKINPRSRSAKLRAAIRTDAPVMATEKKGK